MAHAVTAPRLLPVPASEPPYDDEEHQPRRWEEAAGQAPLPLVFQPWRPRQARAAKRPGGTDAVSAHATPAALTVVPASATTDLLHKTDDPDDPPSWRRSSRAELCDPYQWAVRLARGIGEVLSGARPPRQLATWLAPDALAVLLDSTPRRPTLVRSAGRAVRQPRVLVRSVHTCEPSDGVCEISIHLRIGARSSAVAMRAEGRNGRWICTELILG